MCMILDTNKWGDFLHQKEEMKPIHKWLNNKNGKLIYSNHDAFDNELSYDHRKRLERYLQMGKARLISKDDIEPAMQDIRKTHVLQSNDVHILGLAKISGTKILCSADKNLHTDFKNVIRGKIYQTGEHAELLTKDTCP